MFELHQTEIFAQWLEGLTDIRAIAKVDVRLRRLSLGHFGDAKALGDQVSELRIDYGPGYRVYFTRRGEQIILLLCGGTKTRQSADINRAKQMVQELGNDT
jgi:putative addiction module killer protein